MPKDEPMWKKIGLAEQRSSAGRKKKRRNYELWKKGQATQDDYRDVVGSCRKKNKRTKAQLGHNLTTSTKDNYFYFL